jgi:TetR/AcrR family transcriptional regulator, cholesterol catabolism regulator
MEMKERIVEQASSMFFKYGIRSITMDEIAESLGISKRTLYESFSNKEELLIQCMECTYKQNKILRQSVLEEFPNDPLEIIHQHFRQMIIAFNFISPNFFNDLKKYYIKIWLQHVESKQEENVAFTKSIIESGIRTGIFKAEINTDILSEMIHITMREIVINDHFPETRYPKAEVWRQILLNFIRGMATQEGLKKIDEKLM